MKKNHQPICFVISSPSGAGKTTLVEKILLKDQNVKKTISHTTRAKRPDEKNAVHYYFVSKKKFQELQKQKKLLEWARVYGNYYATSKKEIQRILNKGFDAILVIENKGAKIIRRLFPRSVFVLILPPSLKELAIRMRRREHGGDNIQKRLGNAKKEIRNLLWYDYVIINKNVSESVQSLQSIIQAERSKLVFQQNRQKLVK